MDCRLLCPWLIISRHYHLKTTTSFLGEATVRWAAVPVMIPNVWRCILVPVFQCSLKLNDLSSSHPKRRRLPLASPRLFGEFHPRRDNENAIIIWHSAGVRMWFPLASYKSFICHLAGLYLTLFVSRLLPEKVLNSPFSPSAHRPWGTLWLDPWQTLGTF